MTRMFLDYDKVATLDELRAFVAAGAAGIVRYIRLSDADPTEITRQEVVDAHSVGLEVLFVIESNPTFPGYFTAVNGERDAQRCLAFLDALGAPAAVPFYLPVDTNIDPNLTLPYFNAADPIIQASPRAGSGGVYGYETMVEFARSEFGNLGRHLWQTYGNPHYPLDLWQRQQTNVGGVTVDINDCYIEGWKGADMNEAQVRAIVADYLANTYGPALEAELVQRFSDNDDAVTKAAVAASLRAASAKLAA